MKKKTKPVTPLSPLSQASNSLVEVLSDLDGFILIGQDRRVAAVGSQLNTRKAMSYFRVGLRTGIAEVALLPLLAPLSVGIWGGYVPLCGHFADSLPVKIYGLVLACWMPFLITGLMCIQITKGTGALWSRGFRRLLEGRTLSLFVGATVIFFVLRLFKNMIQPLHIYILLSPLLDGTRWGEFLLTCLRRIHEHLGYSAALVVQVLFLSAILPWAYFAIKSLADKRYQARLMEILD
jgi:hypothetical protein